MTTDITAALAYLTSLHEGATSRPWTHGNEAIWAPIHGGGNSADDVAEFVGGVNGALIAVTRNVLPELLSVIAAAEYALQWLDTSDYKSAKRAGYADGPDLRDALTALTAAVERERVG